MSPLPCREGWRPTRLLLGARPPTLLRTGRSGSRAGRRGGAGAYCCALHDRGGDPGRPAEVRRLARQERSLPILDTLEPFLREKLQLISQKTKLAEAIRYALSRWEGLCRFAGDGRIEIDNNTVERSIRPLALTRKNALFAGSDGGAGHWAVIASLVETCKLIGVDPQAYMAAVITLIIQGPLNSATDELMPWQFKPSERLAAVA